MARVNEISIGITGKTDGLKKAVGDAKSEVKSLEGAVKDSSGKIENAFAGIGASGGGASTAIAGIVGAGVLVGIAAAAAGFKALAGIVEDYGKACFTAAVETERWGSKMRVLIGNGEESRRVLKSIVDLANDLPIATGDVFEGARKVLLLTGDQALISIKSMRELADLAVFTGGSFDDTAQKVGKFFQSLQAGKTDGVAALKDAGVVTADFVKKLDDLVKRQGTVREAWALFIADTKRAEGAVKEQADTWDGAVTQMKNMAHDLASEIGEPFKDAAKDGIKQVIEWIKGPEGQAAIESLKGLAKEAGEFVKVVGPQLIRAATDGIKSVIDWMNGEEAKTALSWLRSMGEAASGFTRWMSGKTLVDFGQSMRTNGDASRPRIQVDTSRVPSSWRQATGLGLAPVNPFGGALDARDSSGNVLQGPERVGKAIASALLGATKGAGRPLGEDQGLGGANPGTNRLGSPPKRNRSGGARGGRGSSSVSGPGWLETMLEDWVGEIYDIASRNAEKWGDLMEEIGRKQLLLAGASKEAILAFDLSDGKFKDLSAENKTLARKSEELEWALEAKARRKDMIEQLRNQARETGSLALVEETLSKAEMTQSKMLFAAYTARARQTLAVEEGRKAADAMIRGYREEMGLIPKLTEHARALIAVWSDPKLKGMSAEDRGRVLGAAKDKDVFDAQQGLQGFIADLQSQLGIEKKISQEYILREKLRSGQFQGGWKSQAYAMFLAKSADGTLTGKDSSSDGLNSAIGMSQDAFDKMRYMQDVIANGADRMAYVLLDSFMRIGEGADAMFDSLIGGFRSVLADMAAEFLQSQIRGLLFNILGGVGRRGGGLSDASSSGGGQSMVSAAGGRAPVVVNMPVYVQDPGGLKKSMGQIQQEAFAKASEAARRNG